MGDKFEEVGDIKVLEFFFFFFGVYIKRVDLWSNSISEDIFFRFNFPSFIFPWYYVYFHHKKYKIIAFRDQLHGIVSW